MILIAVKLADLKDVQPGGLTNVPDCDKRSAADVAAPFWSVVGF